MSQLPLYGSKWSLQNLRLEIEHKLMGLQSFRLTPRILYIGYEQ